MALMFRPNHFVPSMICQPTSHHSIRVPTFHSLIPVRPNSINGAKHEPKSSIVRNDRWASAENAMVDWCTSLEHLTSDLWAQSYGRRRHPQAPKAPAGSIGTTPESRWRPLPRCAIGLPGVRPKSYDLLHADRGTPSPKIRDFVVSMVSNSIWSVQISVRRSDIQGDSNFSATAGVGR